MRPAVRGVFRVPFVSAEGFPVLISVRADGRKLSERAVWPVEDADDVLLQMWGELNDADPVEADGWKAGAA